jgi:hypothetical protein
MKKNMIILATVMVLAALFFAVGCNPSQIVDYKVGDKIGDGFVITFVDSEGGWEAQKQDADGAAVQEGGLNVMKVSGRFTEDRTWDAESVWYLDNLVFIGKDTADEAATLTIKAGALIKGISGVTPGTLVITRNSKIEAEGTAAKPIVMTSALPAGSRGPGDWGGLVINGNAHLNVEGGEAEGEGNSGTYGGGSSPTNDESSGTLKYVRVEYAGRVFTSEDELNGIAFQAIGSGTEVDYIQVHQNKDDGVEFFGGTVSASHVVLTGNQDDSVDWTSGWTGSIQYLVVQQYPGAGDKLIEADSQEDNNDATPRSNPTIANATFISRKKGMKFRRGTSATLVNSIITNVDAGETAITEMDDSGNAKNVTYKGVLTDSATAVDDAKAPDWDTTGGTGSAETGNHNLPTSGKKNHIPTLYGNDENGDVTFVEGDIEEDANYSFGVEPAAAPDGTAQSTGLETAGDSFIGAVKAGGTDWTSGWITTAAN